MVKHIVLFKLINQADRERAKEALLEMKGKIDGLIDVEVGCDFLGSNRSYDLALICTLKDRDALIFYQSHPLHVPAKELMAQIRESSISCDFEY